ncbi:MAG: CpsD/CapB family tyrosine-protein kinase [Eubacterium sp.]|uniref:CpsD/CapB family tyrosine-protein kinase n=1 Tax=Eubacterium sp. TaxID=142586 RepID=UPI003A364C35
MISLKKKTPKTISKPFSRDDSKKMLTPESPFLIKEAYSSIRTNLLFTQKGEKCPIFVVTSPLANNGKTINSINLAISFAQMGKRTLLIDSDMRNPTIHRMFSIPVKNGLSEILAGLTDNITVSKTEIENLSVLTGGKIPPNPAELLASSRMDKLLEFVKEHYDCVFIDTPPVNIVTDATVFAEKTTGYIMVVKSNENNTNDVKSAINSLDSIGGKILGFILNDAGPDSGKFSSYYKKYGYKYKYSYGYGYGYNNK